MIGPVVDSLLRQSVDFRHSAILLLEVGVRPVMLYENYRGICSQGVMDQFLSGTYLLSPYYNSLVSGRLLEFSVISDYISAEGLGVWESGVGLYPHVSLDLGGLADEVCFACVVEERAIIYLAMRSAGETVFSQRELAVMKAGGPIIQGLLAYLLSESVKPDVKGLGQVSPQHACPLSPSTGDEDALGVGMCIESFFTEMLSPREKSSIAMTLEGKSPFAIAEDLGISPHTVRVHLRNAYGKLRVRNRLELVGMFVKRAGFKSRSSEVSIGEA
jgi:DNA-binding CsgD family transcriptional regulator